MVLGGRGRPPIWCSDICRRLASEERRAAQRAEQPVEIREVVRERVVTRTRPISPDTAVDRVLADSAATEKLLRVLAYRMRHEPPHDSRTRDRHARLKPLIVDLTTAHSEVDDEPTRPTQPVAGPKPPPADRVTALREAVALVMGSPRAVREVLAALTDQARQGTLSGAQHSGTVAAAEMLFGALVNSGAIRRR